MVKWIYDIWRLLNNYILEPNLIHQLTLIEDTKVSPPEENKIEYIYGNNDW